MKHLYKFVTKIKQFFLVALVSLLFNQSFAQVACSSCTSNDFQFNSFYIGDAAGVPLSGSCTVGSPVTAHLWMNVTNNSTRYSLKVYYDIQEYNPMTTATTTTNVNNCLYNNVAIPNTLIDLGTITYTCGNQLTIANFQMHWKQNNSISCSFDAPKCLCVPPTVVAAQLASSFSYAACNNGATSTVNFTSNVIGGTAPFTYNWSFGDMTSSTLANPTKTYTNPGPYTATLTVTDANGVVSSSNQSISFPAQNVAPTVTVTQPTCSVSTGTITVTSPTGSGITYSRDGGATYQSSATFSGLASGNYNIVYKNAAGCVSATTVATVDPAPVNPAAPSVTVTQPTCSVSTGTITVTAPTGVGMTYSIDGINYQSSTTFSGVAPGSYSVRAKSSGGCVSTATSATVNAQPSTPSAPTLSVTQPSCTVATGTITISAPTGVGITYSIDGINYQSSPTFSGVSAGSYSVRAKSSAGCISTITNATVNTQPSTPAAPTVSLSQPSCSVATGTITITAPTGGGVTYSIDGINYQSSTTFSGVAAGTY
ncbi:MAG: PKD domain-containing protein, partial [Dolichospermum sp.]